MELWKSLISAAVHAPSPHNVQPWRIKILSDTRADLFIDNSRTLPKEDVTGNFMILAMGLFLEALSLLAANRGLRLSWSLLIEPNEVADQILKSPASRLLPFARMTITEDRSTSSEYADELFLKRRTSRLPLKQNQVPSAIEGELKALASTWGQQYEQLSDAQTIEKVMHANTDALFEDLNSAEYHDEIVEWFRFSDRASRRTRDGLDYRCMNSSRISFWLAARYPRVLTAKWTRALFAAQYRRQLGPIPTLGILSGDFWEPSTTVKTGRFLMRFWLETAKHNLYIHPYGNLVTNRSAAEWCRQTLGLEKIWLIFKIGVSDEPPISYRRPFEEVLID
jgi:hypothetical protein